MLDKSLSTSINLTNQDFADGGADLKVGGRGTNLLFGQFFSKNCMKMKEIGPKGDHASLQFTPSPSHPIIHTNRPSTDLYYFWQMVDIFVHGKIHKGENVYTCTIEITGWY